MVVHVDDLLSVGKRKHLDNFFAKLEKALKLNRVEYSENGKSVLFLGDHISKYKEKVTIKCKDAYVDNMLATMGITDKHTAGAKGVCSKRRRRDT